MKNYTMFFHDYLFGGKMVSVSPEAKLLYIKMNFYANNGFVSNTKEILDLLGYDASVLRELLIQGELLQIEGREEVFITAYFVHNKALDRFTWLKTPFAIYWRGKLFIKENGVATLKRQKEESDDPQLSVDIESAPPEPKQEGSKPEGDANIWFNKALRDIDPANRNVDEEDDEDLLPFLGGK